MIERVEVSVFTTTAWTAVDPHGHRHPSAEHEIREALLEITDSDGVVGRVQVHPDQLRPAVLDSIVKPVLLGADPWDREGLWRKMARKQRGSHGRFTDRALGYVDTALWDLVGKKVGQPVWKLLGGARSRVPAYASTMCGDEVPGGLSTPGDYAAFAKQLVERGYRAIKLHTWMPPVPGAPSVRADIAACEAVRDAVGPDVELMLDANHWYSRTEALELGRALERLGFYWFEEPMEEASISSYRWLAEQLSIPVIGPEVAWGKHLTRAEWITSGACDILRAGPTDVGGISPTVKALHLAEAFNVDCEIHGDGSASLAVLGGTDNGRWYERGLLHPLHDFDRVPPHRLAMADPLDADGHVTLTSSPGLGDEFDVEHIRQHTVERW
ncbi:enolase C-terminal domain-like protein [Saccharothrix texasensis]|uniref:L-alanine-DL-glutamate epimerase-like enolase superfamily enzyme n=1 Tax=Saccharothrix texasensis TaxID=103734 RepID=A0A3N1H2P9_9PSEU|nr:enolase C-terminal domain-like protein [Saccharothrix texasensis]ROP36686.1 L-alanine-DL-glutamate epimerase-like enolase superfamily enzyme [Saccharothrix texasensis]